MRILIIDNNRDPDSWGAVNLRRLSLKFKGTTVFVRRAPHCDLPKNISNYDRIVISGSRTSALEEADWISNLDSFIRTALDGGKPILGVCYGHQMLCRVLGGKSILRKAAMPEFGWTRIESREPSPLFDGLPKVFYSFSSHFEEVAELPSGMKRLASSEHCGIQACQLEDRPVFGIQFHPEKDLSSAEKTFAERRKKRDVKALLHPDGGDKYFDPSVGETIFGNFFKL